MTRVTSQAIRAYCQRQHVEFVADTDWVYPDNLDALEHGFNALTYRDKGNFKTEEECWGREKGAQRRIRPIENPCNLMMTSDGFGYPNPATQYVR